MARQRIAMLEKYGQIFNRRASALKKELHFTQKARDLLAQAVDPIALVRLHVLSERNLSLESVIVLVRQALRACPPDTTLTALEQDIDRLLGGKT
jgi:hypothetical protein